MDTNRSLMNKFIIHITAIGIGLFAGLICLYFIESIGYFIYPLPQKVESNIFNDIRLTQRYVNTVPTTGLLFPILSYIIGSFVGGFVSNTISKRVYTSLYVGAFILALNFINLLLIPHPLWFQVLSSLIPFLFAFLGGKIAKQYYLNSVN